MIIKKNRISVIYLLFVISLFVLPVVPTYRAYAEDAWKERIMELCAKTDVAMTLSPEELKSLIAGCEKLKPVIDSLEETPRKVYGKRLKMCRDLFSYVLESKEQKPK